MDIMKKRLSHKKFVKKAIVSLSKDEYTAEETLKRTGRP